MVGKDQARKERRIYNYKETWKHLAEHYRMKYHCTLRDDYSMITRIHFSQRNTQREETTRRNPSYPFVYSHSILTLFSPFLVALIVLYNTVRVHSTRPLRCRCGIVCFLPARASRTRSTRGRTSSSSFGMNHRSTVSNFERAPPPPASSPSSSETYSWRDATITGPYNGSHEFSR